MIIGSQKCGTSTLFDILNGHPKLIGCSEKEPDFFSDSPDWKSNLDDYEALFPASSKDSLFFEGSTSYTFYPFNNLDIWESIYKYNPNMKFIYLVRRPVDRIISSYMHNYERGYTSSSFADALIKERFYIDTTRYATQINPFINRFGKDNILIIDFDDLNRSRSNVLREISRLLNVDFDGFQDYENSHSNISVGGVKPNYRLDGLVNILRKISSLFPEKTQLKFRAGARYFLKKGKRSFSEKPKMSSEQVSIVNNMLDLEIRSLEKITGKDFSHFLSL